MIDHLKTQVLVFKEYKDLMLTGEHVRILAEDNVLVLKEENSVSFKEQHGILLRDHPIAVNKDNGCSCKKIIFFS